MNILITGVSGQDGSNMAEMLLGTTEHKIYGTIRHHATPDLGNIQSFVNNPRFKLLNMDLTDNVSIIEVMHKCKPDMVLNFAGQSSVPESWNMPHLTAQINLIGVISLLECIRNSFPKCKFYSAGTSEQFGDVSTNTQNEDTPQRARSPYAVSKIAAQQMVKVYRDSYQVWAVHCICFNHEGPRRGSNFLTRKISLGVAKIHLAMQRKEALEPIIVGNIFAHRDWSDSDDFMKAIWLIMNSNTPSEYVLGSGQAYTVKEFIDAAFENINCVLDWHINLSDPTNTYATLTYDDVCHTVIQISAAYFRPAEVDLLRANISKIQNDLKWSPSITFKQLVHRMVDNDIKILKNSS